MKCYLFVVLICTSLMTNDITHLLICLFAICIYSVKKCPLMFFCQFLIGLFALLLLRCRCSLYILDTSPLPNIWFANISFHSEGALLLSLWVLWSIKLFNFEEIQFIFFVLITYTLLSCLRNHCQIQGHKEIPYIF